MILVDAIYINNSGGKILLDYLIITLESNGFDVCYLLDDRVENKHPKINSKNSVVYLRASLVKRHKFYVANSSRFKKILCFGNLPPTIRTKAVVYTYFHQKLFLEIPKQLPIKQKIMLNMKALIFKKLSKNTDFWLVQTQAMKDSLSQRLSKNANIILVPFYSKLVNEKSECRKDNTFLYVSSGSEHKNHKNLLLGFKKFYDQYAIGQLHLTVGNEFVELYDLINQLILENYPIVNHGFVERSKLVSLYKSCTFVVYPSLSESFGLGIIEALENDCKIIGADLPYTYSVCIPSLVFNPLDYSSIAESFKRASYENTKQSKQLIFNEIDTLLSLLN